MDENGPGSSPLAADPQADPVLAWLAQKGLQGNPFGEGNARLEENIRDYYVAVQDLYIATLLARQSPWIVFAAVGRGKTALRKMIASECWPARADSDILALEFEGHAWDTLKGLAGAAVPPQPILYVQTIVEVALERLQQGNRGTSASLAPLRKIVTASPASLRPQPCLDQLREVAAVLRFSRVMGLVDELDTAFLDAPPETMLDWIRPLLHPEIRGGLTLRYLLPDTIEEALLRESKRLGLGACRMTRVRWEEDDLIALLAQRMRAFSTDPMAPYTSVGQLCEENLARGIDRDIAHTAEDSPRAAVYLADKLLWLHCQKREVMPRIQPPTWRKTKEEWQRYRDTILDVGPSFGGDGGFSLRGRNINFAGTELRLGGRDYALLRRLVEAGGGLCPLRDLAAAGWPDDEPQGIRDKTVQEAVRRMKARLQEQGVDPAWVEAVTGRGYRLRVPASGGAEEPGPPMPPPSDVYTHLEAGLEELKRRLAGQPKKLKEALVHEARLLENIAQARLYGDKSGSQADRAEIIDRLNALCLDTLDVDFGALGRQALAGGGTAPGGSEREERKR